MPPNPPGDDTPEQPLLIPGSLVTRRDDGHLQVGLDARRAVVTADTPAARAALRDLTAGRRPAADLPTRRLLELLARRGLVVDGTRLRGDLPASASAGHAVAAVYSWAASAAPAVLSRRAARSVGIELPTELVDGLSDVTRADALLRRLLDAGGVATADPRGQAPYAVLLVSLGELDRTRVDALIRADRPHLLLAFVEGTARLGPFVVPGVTACLRCVDAHLGEVDPRRALVVEQYAASRRADGVPEPLDPAVTVAALAWAVRELVAFVDEDEPDTWSATIELGPGMHQRRTEWTRHPQCGCAWDDLAVLG